MRYFKKIEGQRLYLSPINTDDAEIYTKWLNDPAVSVTLGNYNRVLSLHGERKFLETMATEGYNFAIVRSCDDVLMGNTSLIDINHVSRKATIGIFIGDAENRGKGYGAEALRLLVNYGFKTLNLHNIMLQVFSDNTGAINCYKKVGFKEFGRRREACYKNGQYVDDVYMDILETEFYI